MTSHVNNLLTWLALILGTLGMASTTIASDAEPLDAQASDPANMGWMQGFPPPADKIITQPDSNYFSFPKLRWTVCHLRELLPTEKVSRGIDAPVPLPYDLDEVLSLIAPRRCLVVSQTGDREATMDDVRGAIKRARSAWTRHGRPEAITHLAPDEPTRFQWKQHDQFLEWLNGTP